MYEDVYDPTAGDIQTPDGRGKYVWFDGLKGECIVEMDYMYLVRFDASKCYLPASLRLL